MLELITDRLLIDLKNGREDAFTVIFNELFPRLCKFAVNYVNDNAVAKNIVQDVFLKCWENRQSINENKSVTSYLLTITKNLCLDYLKHKRVEHSFQNQSSNNYQELELNYYALKRLEIDFLDYHELMQLIEKTLETLPPQCQKVFRMSRFNNLSHSEIALKLEISQKAVEANITRAIKVFRKELKDYISVFIILNIL